MTFEPESPPDAVPPVVHVHVQGAIELRSLGLFEGVLSSYALGRIKSGELPATVSERQVPAVAYRVAEEVVLAPSRALVPGAEYSLASAQGLVGQFRVASGAARPLLERVWPPPDGAGHFVYCASQASTFVAGTSLLEPGSVSVSSSPGVDDSGALAERCVHFELSLASGSGSVLVPPVTLAPDEIWALDPQPIVGATAQAVSPLACAEGELALGLGCARADDDRLLVRTPDAPVFWRVTTRGGAVAQLTVAGVPLVIHGLSPAASEHVAGVAYDALGNARPFESTLQTEPAHAHLVLSEALANPLGPEPASEWVELVNDGSTPLSLEGFQLHDSKASNALPAATLAPREYALLVRDDFTPGGSDVAPAAGTQLLRMPELGSGGLGNGGEALSLTDAAGVVVSSFPALAPRAGESAARRYPWSPDGVAASFSTGAPTPGIPNAPP